MSNIKTWQKQIHDIRNPLNTISMNAELGKLMIEKQKPSEDIIRTLNAIIEQCQLCSEKLDQIKHTGSNHE